MNNQPIQPKPDRIVALDVLRGFALFGVLMVNMLDFSSSALIPGYTRPDWNLVNQIADGAIYFLAVTKFYLLFSFLFGVGFAVQMGRMSQSGRSFVPFYLRRLAVLFVIGALHAVFLWRGDILMVYALLGGLLLLVRRAPDRVLIAGVLIILVGSLIGAGVLLDSRNTVSHLESVPIYRTGSYWDVVTLRLNAPIDEADTFAQVPTVMVMFLLGLVIGRRGILERPDTFSPFLRRWMWTALGVGLIFNALFVIGWYGQDSWLTSLGTHVGAPALSFFYASVVLLNASRLKFLAPVGQMALTNYLTQSFVCTTLFYGYGGGLYDQITPVGHIMLVMVIYGVQIILSRWWMQRVRFGPMEWLWRSLTYGQVQPFKRANTPHSR